MNYIYIYLEKDIYSGEERARESCPNPFDVNVSFLVKSSICIGTVFILSWVRIWKWNKIKVLLWNIRYFIFQSNIYGSRRNWSPRIISVENGSVAVARSVWQYGCTIWTLTKRFEYGLDVGTIQECYMLFWINPGSSTLQNSSCLVSYFQYHKPFK